MNTAASWVILVVSLGRVFGGAVLLHLLGAPAWAVAAWVMAGVRVRVGRPRQSRVAGTLADGRPKSGS